MSQATAEPDFEMIDADDDAIDSPYDEARRRVTTADRQVRQFVVDHPFAAVFGAVAVGYFVGRLVSRL